MSDVVVTIPKSFTWPDAPGKRGLDAWLAEGGLPGELITPISWIYWLGPHRPRVSTGDRVYVTAHGRLIGYAPLYRLACTGFGKSERTRYGLERRCGAHWTTIEQPIRGFRGYRYRWWQRSDERTFLPSNPTDAACVLRAAMCAARS